MCDIEIVYTPLRSWIVALTDVYFRQCLYEETLPSPVTKQLPANNIYSRTIYPPTRKTTIEQWRSKNVFRGHRGRIEYMRDVRRNNHFWNIVRNVVRDIVRNGSTRSRVRNYYIFFEMRGVRYVGRR